MALKVIALCVVIATATIARAGFIANNQLQASPGYTVSHPATVVNSGATSSVNIVRAAPSAVVAAAPSVAHYAAAPIAHAVRVEPYDPHPHYTYAYDVNDPSTGDSKNQHESRTGDVVRGQYSLTNPDGSRRTVDYSADPHSGFNAVVRTTHPHPVAVPIPAPVQQVAVHPATTYLTGH